MNNPLAKEIYENLKSGYETGLKRQRNSLATAYGVELTPLQIKILSAVKANAHCHGREYTGFEQRQVAHMIYGINC